MIGRLPPQPARGDVSVYSEASVGFGLYYREKRRNER